METGYILILAGSVILTVIAAGIIFSGRTRRKVNYMLDALEDKETNFRFREETLVDRRLNRTLNRLRNIFEKEKDEIRQQERYYGQMLDHVQTGIVVIDEDGERVNYCNAKALQVLGMATFSSIRQLRRISEPLADAFRKVAEGVEERAGYYNESSRITLSITASSALIRGKNVKIVAFNDISSDIEENEAESWTRLIRVLTHEIMNTVTPIASLSDALARYMEETDGKGAESPAGVPVQGPDIKAGLETIASSSKGLIKFVNSYRDLTHIAAPSRKAFFLKDLIGSVQKLTAEQFAQAGAVLSYQEKDEDILLYADEDQGRVQQRASHQQGKPGGDIRAVLHHQAFRDRHRAQHLETDHETAQRKPEALQERQLRHSVHIDFPLTGRSGISPPFWRGRTARPLPALQASRHLSDAAPPPGHRIQGT